MAIDIGPGCDKSNTGAAGYTIVEKTNPANATGKIDYLCLQASSGSTADVATFIDEGSNVLSTRGIVQGLTLVDGAPQEYNAPGDFVAFDVNTGDYLGVWVSASHRRDSSGVGQWGLNSDQIPASSVEFTYLGTSYTYGMYATGTESGAGVAPTGGLYGPLVGPLGGPI